MLCLLALLAGLCAAPAAAANCNIATSQGATGPGDWQTYCWFDLAGFSDATARGASGQAFSYTLPDGTIMTFRLRVTGPGLVAAASPSWTGAAVGNTAFLGISGRPILYQTAAGTSVITISQIVLTPPAGGTVTNYMFVAADAESTNSGEVLQFQTNGGPWSILGQIGPISGNTYPVATGAGTNTFTETGVAGTVGAYIVGSTSPTEVVTTMVGSGLQGAMFAVRFASITLNTVIQGTRVAAADQFTFSIAPTGGGAAYATGTSSGTGLGPFNAAALPTSAALPLTLTQAMAGGSASTIGQYRSSLSCSNSSSGSSTVMPNNVVTTSYNFGTLQFGDRVACTFTQTPFPHLTLTKAIATSGRRYNSDQFTMEIAQGGNVVATTTTTGTGATIGNGMTPQHQAIAGTTYTLREVGAGTTALDQYTATMTCTNAWAGSPTALPAAPGGTVNPRMGDVISCTITNTRRGNNATLSVTKTSWIVSDPYRATSNPLSIPGAVVRYSIQISNSGNQTVTSNSIFILDALPAQIAVGSAASPVFAQGTPASGLTFNAATDLRYSNAATAPASFAACAYTPVSAYDPAVRFVCLNPKGTMAASTGTPPSFTVSFEAQVQ
jgi:uncharacterized repeat protein (TIGR01451 family)